MNQEEVLVDAALSALADQPDINARLASIETLLNLLVQEVADIREELHEFKESYRRVS